MNSWQEVALSDEVTSTIDVTGEKVTTTTTKPKSTPKPEDPEDELSEEQLALIAAELSKGDKGDDKSDGKAIELTNQLAESNARIARLEADLAQERYVDMARRFIDKGVPPAMLEIAKPLLTLPRPPVLELSNDEKIDVIELVKDMLTQTEGFLDLAKERGSSVDKRDPADRAQELLSQWKM
jgi:hypothetical protein